MDTTRLATITGAARVVQIPRSTIRSAIERGEIETFTLGDSTTVVNLDELRAWDEARNAGFDNPDPDG